MVSNFFEVRKRLTLIKTHESSIVTLRRQVYDLMFGSDSSWEEIRRFKNSEEGKMVEHKRYKVEYICELPLDSEQIVNGLEFQGFHTIKVIKIDD